MSGFWLDRPTLVTGGTGFLGKHLVEHFRSRGCGELIVPSHGQCDLLDRSSIQAFLNEHRVDVVSSSFGECELDFTAAANGGVDFTGILQVFHALFAQGNAQGITFVASSGDNGALACTSTAFDKNPKNGTNFVLGVENPASDPSVTSVMRPVGSTVTVPVKGIGLCVVLPDKSFQLSVPLTVPSAAGVTMPSAWRVRISP